MATNGDAKAQDEDMTKFIKSWMFKPFRDEGYWQAKSEYDKQIIKKYEDPFFPPNGDSLGEKICRKFKDLYWRPAPDFITGVEILDLEKEQKVNQGRIGDCYLLNPISLLAIIQKNMISRLFTIKKTNPFGYYGVWLFIDGKWQYINVDENFPWWTTRKKPYFCDVVGGTQIWAMIIEKAWAKLNGEYSRLWGGDTGLAFRVITGAPIKSYGLKKFRKDPRKKEDVYKQIEYHLSQNHLISVTTGELDEYGKSIMTQGHSYALIDYKREENKYIIRDPRGETNVFGKEIYEVDQSELIYLFQCIIVCLLHPSYVFTQHEILFEDEQTKAERLIKLVLDRKSKFTLSFFQPNKRYFKSSEKSKKHKLSKMTFKVLKIDSNNGQIIKAKTISQKNGRHQQIDIDLNLNKGIYYIYCLVEWSSTNHRKINVTSYGPSYVDISDLSSDKKLNSLKEFLEVQRQKKEEIKKAKQIVNESNKQKQPKTQPQQQPLKKNDNLNRGSISKARLSLKLENSNLNSAQKQQTDKAPIPIKANEENQQIKDGLPEQTKDESADAKIILGSQRIISENNEKSVESTMKKEKVVNKMIVSKDSKEDNEMSEQLNQETEVPNSIQEFSMDEAEQDDVQARENQSSPKYESTLKEVAEEQEEEEEKTIELQSQQDSKQSVQKNSTFLGSRAINKSRTLFLPNKSNTNANKAIFNMSETAIFGGSKVKSESEEQKANPLVAFQSSQVYHRSISKQRPLALNKENKQNQRSLSFKVQDTLREYLKEESVPQVAKISDRLFVKYQGQRQQFMKAKEMDQNLREQEGVSPLRLLPIVESNRIITDSKQKGSIGTEKQTFTAINVIPNSNFNLNNNLIMMTPNKNNNNIIISSNNSNNNNNNNTNNTNSINFNSNQNSNNSNCVSISNQVSEQKKNKNTPQLTQMKISSIVFSTSSFVQLPELNSKDKTVKQIACNFRYNKSVGSKQAKNISKGLVKMNN